MSKNIDQVFIANPITTNASTDLMYFGQSPYSSGNDAAMTYVNFAAQFGAPYTAAALTRTNDTNVTVTLGGTPATALLHAASLTLGWTGQLAVPRGGTGLASATAYAVLCGGTTSTGAFQSVVGLGSSGDVLTSNGAGALPTFQAAAGGGVTSTQVQLNTFNESTDSGVVNAYVGAYTPAITGFGSLDGVTFVLNTINFTNTGAATFDNGAGAKPVITPTLNALVGGEMVLNNTYQLMYNQFADAYVLLNSSLTVVSSNPWSAGAGTGSAKGGDGSESAAGDYSVVYGFNGSHTAAGVQGTFVFGNNNNAVNGSGYSFLGGLNSGLNSASVGICWGNNANCNSANYFLCVGDNVTVGGSWGFVFGLGCTTAASFSLAVGNGSHSANTGSYVWSDSNGSPATDSAADQWVSTFKGGYRFYTLATPTLVVNIDTLGNLINLKGIADQSYSLQVPTTGFSITIVDGVVRQILNPAGTLLAGTIVMPSAPIDGQIVKVSTTQTITSLTVSGNSGQSVIATPTTLVAGGSFSMIYVLIATTWFPTA